MSLQSRYLSIFVLIIFTVISTHEVLAQEIVVDVSSNTDHAQNSLRGFDAIGVYSCEEGGACTEFANHVMIPSDAALSQEDVLTQLDRAREWQPVQAQQARLADYPEETLIALTDAKKRSFARGSSLIEISVSLAELPFNVRSLRGLDPKTENTKKAEFEERIAKSQRSVRSLVRKLGGQDEEFWGLQNIVHASVPPSAVLKIAAHEDVVGISIDGDLSPSSNGLQRRRALGLPDSIPSYSPLSGGSGSTVLNNDDAPQVKIGVIEVDSASLHADHVGYLDTAGGVNRIVDTDTCRLFGVRRRCKDHGSTTAPGHTHGDVTTSIALGSIEQGQDSTVSNSTARNERSGIATEAVGHYYRVRESVAERKNTSRAISVTDEDGIDVINMSFGPDPNCAIGDYNGIQGGISNRVELGILPVVSAGNAGTGSKNTNPNICTINPYAYNPDSIAVAALTNVTSFTSLNNSTAATYSSRGRQSTTLAGGRTTKVYGIDLAVTGTAHLTYAADSGYASYAGNGTSFAAPQIVGLAASLKNWLQSQSYPLALREDPYVLRVLLSLMGDGKYDTGVGEYTSVWDISSTYGFGRVRYVDFENDAVEWTAGILAFSSSSVGIPHYIPLHAGARVPTNVEGLKAVVIANVHAYDGAPDFSVRVVDTCPAGGGTDVLSPWMAYRANKGRIFLPVGSGSVTAGTCAKLEVTPVALGGYSAIELYYGWYTYDDSEVERHEGF